MPETPRLDSGWNALTAEEQQVIKNVIAWALMAQINGFLHSTNQNIAVMKSIAEKLQIPERRVSNDR